MLKREGISGKTPDRQPGRRYRNITERTKSLLFLLREVPYVTLKDIRRIFFPRTKSRSYCLEMTGVLLKNQLIEKYMIGDGVFIYYLSAKAIRLLEYFMQSPIRFHAATKSFYYEKAPRVVREANPFFFFPATRIEYKLFSPHLMNLHPYKHSAGLFELYILFRNAYRFLYVLWLDQVEAKKAVLSIPFFPDMLLTNDPFTEAGRVYVEFENSKIRTLDLLTKINHLTSMPAEWYLVLCSSEDILLNFGKVIRKILMGEAKSQQKTLFFSARSQAVLSRNLLIGVWVPSFRAEGEIQKLRTVELYRYDHEHFDKTLWVNMQAEGMQVKDLHGAIPLKHPESIPYPARRPGQRSWNLGVILDQYSEGFKVALRNTLAPSPSSGSDLSKGEAT